MKYLQNERGSAIPLLFWYIFVAGFLLIFIYNVAHIFIINEQSGLAAENAGLAASGIVYDEVDDVISDYENDDDDSLEEKVEEEQESIQSDQSYLSSNEAYMEAVNEVLIEEMENDEDLQDEIESALQSASHRVGSVVRDVVADNNGNVAQTEIQFFNGDNRIEVRTHVSYEAAQYGDLIGEITEDVAQEGSGVQMSFVDHVNWVDQTITP